MSDDGVFAKTKFWWRSLPWFSFVVTVGGHFPFEGTFQHRKTYNSLSGCLEIYVENLNLESATVIAQNNLKLEINNK